MRKRSKDRYEDRDYDISKRDYGYMGKLNPYDNTLENYPSVVEEMGIDFSMSDNYFYAEVRFGEVEEIEGYP